MKKSKSFFAEGKRGERNVERVQFHLFLTRAEREKLVALTHKMQLNASDVVRKLIERARA